MPTAVRACRPISSTSTGVDAAGSLVEARAHPEHLEHGAHLVERPQLGSQGSEHVQRRAGGFARLLQGQVAPYLVGRSSHRSTSPAIRPTSVW